MEDRKRRFDDTTDVRKKVEEVVKKLFASAPPFDGVHVFTPHADVPDDTRPAAGGAAARAVVS